MHFATQEDRWRDGAVVHLIAFRGSGGGQYPAKTLRRVTQPGFENEQTVGVRCFEGLNPGTV